MAFTGRKNYNTLLENTISARTRNHRCANMGLATEHFFGRNKNLFLGKNNLNAGVQANENAN
jgi:hypothetical protein